MHFKLFKAILDQVFCTLGGAPYFFPHFGVGGEGGSAKMWKFPHFFNPSLIIVFDKVKQNILQKVP